MERDELMNGLDDVASGLENNHALDKHTHPITTTKPNQVWCYTFGNMNRTSVFIYYMSCMRGSGRCAGGREEEEEDGCKMIGRLADYLLDGWEPCQGNARSNARRRK